MVVVEAVDACIDKSSIAEVYAGAVPPGVTGWAAGPWQIQGR
jgi:hypothetical protein